MGIPLPSPLTKTEGNRQRKKESDNSGPILHELPKGKDTNGRG
ncbi:hypothetical protein B4135_1304 [Caldibacillus debilis]|uniref:Uncharacterized protein n=1 Tax=Caldibacillus debilis TaxID=301148 RepID=A0A150MCG7_9BACI|nr:hypothetical protein B4135_1304 [Caldibacillus debilis]